MRKLCKIHIIFVFHFGVQDYQSVHKFGSNGMSFYVLVGLVKVDIPLISVNNLHDLKIKK